MDSIPENVALANRPAAEPERWMIPRIPAFSQLDSTARPRL